MNKKVIDYCVATTTEEIKTKISEGWQPYKDLSVSYTNDRLCYFQAMVKYLETDINIIEYDIVNNIDEVKQKLKLGWRLYGNLSVVMSKYYSQPMIKYVAS